MPILWPFKVPERGNAITQRKTLEIENSCLFIHRTIWIYPFPHLAVILTRARVSARDTQERFCFNSNVMNNSKQDQPVCTLFAELRSQGTTDSLWYPQKIPTQIKLSKKNTCQIFVPNKIPESKVSNPKKSFGHPRHLKSRVPPPGAWNRRTSSISRYDPKLWRTATRKQWKN